MILLAVVLGVLAVVGIVVALGDDVAARRPARADRRRRGSARAQQAASWPAPRRRGGGAQERRRPRTSAAEAARADEARPPRPAPRPSRRRPPGRPPRSGPAAAEQRARRVRRRPGRGRRWRHRCPTCCGRSSRPAASGRGARAWRRARQPSRSSPTPPIRCYEALQVELDAAREEVGADRRAGGRPAARRHRGRLRPGPARRPGAAGRRRAPGRGHDAPRPRRRAPTWSSPCARSTRTANRCPTDPLALPTSVDIEPVEDGVRIRDAVRPVGSEEPAARGPDDVRGGQAASCPRGRRRRATTIVTAPTVKATTLGIATARLPSASPYDSHSRKPMLSTTK